MPRIGDEAPSDLIVPDDEVFGGRSAASANDGGADPTRDRLDSDEDVTRVSADAQEASDKGISGVPTFVFAQKYAVSGAQPAEQLARAIRQVSAEINAQAAE